jgi:CheY-like chemotaxis protein
MRRVLLADDDPILREIAGEHLRSAGFQLTLAVDGREALKAAQARRFDLIVTDMVMPNLDGIELLQALKTTSPDTPVIAISAGFAGGNAELLLQAARAIGAVSVLEKPLVRDTFLRHVDAALAGAA